jgi:hypothetical protein
VAIYILKAQPLFVYQKSVTSIVILQNFRRSDQITFDILISYVIIYNVCGIIVSHTLITRSVEILEGTEGRSGAECQTSS